MSSRSMFCATFAGGAAGTSSQLKSTAVPNCSPDAAARRRRRRRGGAADSAPLSAAAHAGGNDGG